jgi:chemosensory pili system protein ChpA (sensor histidine kinase/response regulator)
MNAGNLWFFVKLLPLLGLTAILFGLFGWWLRRKFHAPVVASNKPAAAPTDLPARERVKKLEHALTKSEAAQKALKQDLESLHAKTISKATHDKAARELAEAQHRLEADVKRIQALEAELKKSRDAVNTLNSNAAEANKGQRDRTFTLENELSKTRETLAILQARPDNTLVLQAEVDRLREAVTNSTRVIGELRKQETAAVEAMTKAQRKLEAALGTAAESEAAADTGAVSLLPALARATRKQPKPAPEFAFDPVDRVADAKAEVERIHAQNAQKEADRQAAEQAAAQKAETDRLVAAQAAVQAAEQDRLAAEQADAQKAEADRLAAENATADSKAEEEFLAAKQAAAAAQDAQNRLAAAPATAAQHAAQDLLAALPEPIVKPAQSELFADQENA